MDDALRQALKGDYEPHEFHGATVHIRHLSAAERFRLRDQYADEADEERGVRFYVDLVTTAVQGVTEDDADELRNASWPRFEGLAQLVLKVNGMREEDVEQAAGN